jgi:glutamate dehydrogenase (NADP+)
MSSATTSMDPQGNGLDNLLHDLSQKYKHQPVFLQSVREIAHSLTPLFEDPDKGDFYKRAFVVMTEPERTISFRVPWEDDAGNMRYNRGWRVQFSRYVGDSSDRSSHHPFCALLQTHILKFPSFHSVLGPYKGGLRFHPTVDEGVLKFLGFEQVFKNALTGLPMGGGKGGSDFDPKGKSDAEVRRFCQSFMTELFRYIHPSTDVPAGDIGVGGREIGYMYGTYKRLTNRHGEGVLTGKSMLFGGSSFRPEATGYGLVYIAKLAVEKQLDRSLVGMRCAVSGSGNVAQFATKKLLEFGAKVLTVSDSNGLLLFEDGMTTEDFEMIMDCKNAKRGRLSTLDGKVSGKYVDGKSPWNLATSMDIALPCATQNEIDEHGASLLLKNGVLLVGEGANLPTTLKGQEILRSSHQVIYLPAKAANAGGVGVSGLEMSQNAQRLTWKPEEVDAMLKNMMSDIYSLMEEYMGENGSLEDGANIASFVKVAEAMRGLGWIQ